MPRVALARLVALSGVIAHPQVAAAQPPPFDCSQQNLVESTGEDANGWANVFYDYHNLVNPASTRPDNQMLRRPFDEAGHAPPSSNARQGASGTTASATRC